MISLIPAEIRRQFGRRGSFYGSMIFNALFGLGLIVLIIFDDGDTASDAIELGTGLLVFSGIISSIVIGATAGSYDTDQGTMRYLVLTGRPRWQLAMVRIPALLATIVAVTLPAIVLVLISSTLSPAPAASGGMYFDLFYMVWVGAFLFGILSLTIGTFLKSAGVAIAISIVFNFAGGVIGAVIAEYVSEDLGRAMYADVVTVAIDRSASAETLSLDAALAVLAVWLVGLCAAAILRVQRAEY